MMHIDLFYSFLCSVCGLPGVGNDGK